MNLLITSFTTICDKCKALSFLNKIVPFSKATAILTTSLANLHLFKASFCGPNNANPMQLGPNYMCGVGEVQISAT